MGVAQVVECLSNKCKILSSNPKATQKKLCFVPLAENRHNKALTGSLKV
jgi:hypothetical protein